MFTFEKKLCDNLSNEQKKKQKREKREQERVSYNLLKDNNMEIQS